MRGNEHACLHEPAVCSSSSVRIAAPAGWHRPRSPDKEIGARKSVNGKEFIIKVQFSSGRYKIECQRICISPFRCRKREREERTKVMIVSAGS